MGEEKEQWVLGWSKVWSSGPCCVIKGTLGLTLQSWIIESPGRDAPERSQLSPFQPSGTCFVHPLGPLALLQHSPSYS